MSLTYNVETSDTRQDQLLIPGQTCWRLERAQRARFLVDAEEYYTMLKAAMVRARHSIMLLGWDFDTRVPLEPIPSDTSVPNTLGEFVDYLATSRPDLEIRVLKWDYAMLFALEREWIPTFILDWITNPHVHFRLDSEHPIGASHHQKIVTIDDNLAFCGGLDLTTHRWDTRAHLDDDPRRVMPDGTPYTPYHDIMIAVDGKPAASLAELCRERWFRATGEDLPPSVIGDDPWPEAFPPHVQNIDVGIARTLPRYRERQEVREVEALYMRSIAAAKRYIYIENQYFGSAKLGKLLAKRLAEPDGPDIIIVNPKHCSGWLEEEIMGAARARILDKLQRKDRHRRFRALYPVTDNGTPVFVHAKTMVIDDRFLRIGSSNLNNRSMGFDTECDIAVEAVPGTPDEERIRATIADYMNGLLAEHTGTELADVVQARMQASSFAQAVDRLRFKSGRTLRPVSPDDIRMKAEKNENLLLDPERPVDATELSRQFAMEMQNPSPRFRFVLGLVVFLVLALVVALVWHYTGLREYADIHEVLNWIREMSHSTAGPLVVVGAFVLGGVTFFPVTVMVAATAIVLGPIKGFVVALAGCLASALAGYAIGRFAGRSLVQRFAGRFVNKVSRYMAERGIVSMAILHALPLAPYTAVNILAGASHVRTLDFVIGTAVGMVPGIAAFALFGSHLERTLRNPTPTSIAISIGIGILAVSLGWMAEKLLGRWMRRESPDEKAGRNVAHGANG